MDRLTFGKHSGTLVTRVPSSYLTWMVNNETRQCELASAELARRGTVMPKLQLTGHAIDRASQRLLTRWRGTSRKEEGLYSWLHRMTVLALEEGEIEGDCRIYKDIKFVIEDGAEFPVLKSVMMNRYVPGKRI